MAKMANCRRAVLAAGALFLLAGCATMKAPLPDGYTGPKAVLIDSTLPDSRGVGRIFAAVAVDGQPMPSAFTATRQATAGRGMNLYLQGTRREVPVRPMRVALRGGRVTAAPIQAMFYQAKGELPEFEGEVEWTPQANREYIVRGEIAGSGAVSLWIEELETRVKATPVLTSPRTP